MRATSAVAALSLLACTDSASAHRIDEYLQATVLSLSAERVDAAMRLVPGVQVAPVVIRDIDRDGNGVLSYDEQRVYAERVIGDLALTVNGRAVQPALLSWSFPPPAQMRAGLGEIHIEYSAALPAAGQDRHLVLENHHRDGTSVYLMNVLAPDDPAIHVLTQTRDGRQSRYQLDYQLTAASSTVFAPTFASSTWAYREQFAQLFRLGMRHIAAGPDHLLFLLTLLLPAPLLVAGVRWGAPATVRSSVRRSAEIITAFTVGHSLTLALATLNDLDAPTRPIELLIAVSILFSALHAWRPLAAGKEVRIAGFFGLIHGLAFAATLSRLGLEHWQRVSGVLAFNLGIEAMQLVVLAAILPSLIILSRTRVYARVRTAGATFAGAAALCWIAERLFGFATPVDAVTNVLVEHAPYVALGLLAISLMFLSQTRDARPSKVYLAG